MHPSWALKKSTFCQGTAKSCCEEDCSDPVPTADTRAVITFGGMKVEPHFLSLSIWAAVQEQGTLHTWVPAEGEGDIAGVTDT